MSYRASAHYKAKRGAARAITQLSIFYQLAESEIVTGDAPGLRERHLPLRMPKGVGDTQQLPSL
jgi:hypothetical protein